MGALRKSEATGNPFLLFSRQQTTFAREGNSLTEHIVAVFETERAASAAERDLAGAGISSSAIRQYTPAETKKLEPGSSVAETSGGEFWAWLWGKDTDATRSAYSADGEVYDRRAREGNTILSVTLDNDSMIHQTVVILDAHHPLEIDEYTNETEPTLSTSGSFVQPEQAGKSSLSPSGVDYPTSAVTTPGTGTAAPSSAASVALDSDSLPAGMPGSSPATTTTAEDEVIPLAEEHLEVGKRTVDRGTTRVRRYVVEKPVEENVTLRGERVTIERRHPIEGAAASGGAFEERTVEVRETEEVPVVEKTARLVEEVAIRKEATERTETVKDTVRREEVEVTGNNVPSQSPPP
jgi:uncharacterized protein (TIGR02271 family)